MKVSTSTKIVNLLEENGGWVPSYNLIKVNTKWGWIGSSGDRAARKLAETGKIERKQEGKYAFYKAKQKQYKTYRVMGNNGEVEKVLRLPI